MKNGKNLLLLSVFILSSLSQTGCPGPKPRPNTNTIRAITYPAPKITGNAIIHIDGLAYNSGTGKGSLIPTTVQVSPNIDNETNVGVSGNMSGGLGDQWRAAVWIASLQAAFAVGRDLTDYAIIVRGKGYIDGPSAGALFTAGIMAGMLGIPVRDDVTMTGTVNPDGTVGPVGGIPNKFTAAIAAGKKYLGYPIGQRFSKDHRTHQLVDLVALANRAGVNAVEIGTIYDAFRLLTGRTFPRPAAMSASNMYLTQNMMNTVKQKAAKWNRIFTTYKLKFNNLGLNRMKSATNKFHIANQYMDKAVEFIKEGSISSSYDFAQRGASHSFTSYWYGLFHKILFYNKKINLKPLAKVLDVQLFKPVNRDLDAGLAILRKKRPQTVGELMSLIAAQEQLIAAFVYAVDASIRASAAKKYIPAIDILKAKRLSTKKLMLAIYKKLKLASFRVGLATLKVEKAKDFLWFRPKTSNRIFISKQRLKQVDKIFLGAAQANLNYIDSIITKEYAKSMKLTVDKMKLFIRKKSNNYLQAFYSLRIPQNYFAKKWGKDNIGTLYAQIAGSMGSYFNSSMFLMKFYSLGIRRSKVTGNVEAVKMQKALVNMLKQAELNSRIYAAMAYKYVGEIPVPAKIFYNIGMSMKEMEPALKIKALEMFWRASMECHLAVLLTRNQSSATPLPR